MSSSVSNKQPRISNQGVVAAAKKQIAGSSHSQRRLRDLGFDPIGKLVSVYEKLEREEAFQQHLKEASSIQELSKNGTKQKTHRYSGMAHAKILEQMNKVCVDLMRYMYGRVPETVNINQTSQQPMVVNLSGVKERPPVVINQTVEEIENEDNN
jgi:hypothetical protein